MRRPATPLLPLAAVGAALLAGCGGGGGDAGVTVPTGTRDATASAGADVTAANFDTLAAPLVRAVLNAASDSLLDVTGSARERPAQRSGSAAMGTLGSAGRAVRVALDAAARPAREQRAATSSETIPCVSGSLLLTLDDADNNQALSAGDTITVVAETCVAEAGLPPASGQFSMTVNAAELDRQNIPTAIDVSARFTDFSVAGFGTLNGSFRLWSKTQGAGEDLRVSYRGARVSESAGTVVYDMDVAGSVDAAGGRFSLSGGLGVGGQTYVLQTSQPFVYTNGEPPASGAVRMRDGAGDAAQLAAVSASALDLSFFVAGSGTASVVRSGLLWTDFSD